MDPECCRVDVIVVITSVFDAKRGTLGVEGRSFSFEAVFFAVVVELGSAYRGVGVVVVE